MSIVKLEKDILFLTVKEKIIESDILLDIGCGIKPQNLILPLVHICCEPFPEYIQVLSDKIKNLNNCEYVILNVSWEDALKIFPSKSVDSVFLLDVIEHLEKDIALQLLKETEKICRKQIVIFTPLGFLPQEHSDGLDAWGLHGGEMQEHKSGWMPFDFDKNWDIYLSEIFHDRNNLGEKFEVPFGAFFAIRNLSKDESPIHNQKIAIYHIISRLNNKFILRSLTLSLKGLLFLKSKSNKLIRLLSKRVY